MDHAEINQRITSILTLPIAEHKVAIEDLMRDSHKNISQITSTICVRLNKSNQHDFNDFFQFTSMELFKQISLALADPAQMRVIGNWWALVHRRAANSIKSHLISNAGPMPASGMDNLAKRATAQKRIHDKLRQLYQREPSENEVIVAYNEQTYRNRKNPKKQGAIGQHGDMVAASPAESVDVLPDMFVSTMGIPDPESDSPLATSEVAPLVKKIIASCQRESEAFGKVAALWLGDFIFNVDAERMETKEIAERLGVSVSTVRAHLRAVRTIAVDVCGIDFGITEQHI